VGYRGTLSDCVRIKKSWMGPLERKRPDNADAVDPGGMSMRSPLKGSTPFVPCGSCGLQQRLPGDAAMGRLRCAACGHPLESPGSIALLRQRVLAFAVAALYHGAAERCGEGTRFWIVRPCFDPSGIGGLDTPRPLPAAQLSPDGDRWRIDRSVRFPESMQGLAAVAASDDRILGVLVVEGRDAWVVPLSQSP
jgi:hypothetical protein